MRFAYWHPTMGKYYHAPSLPLVGEGEGITIVISLMLHIPGPAKNKLIMLN